MTDNTRARRKQTLAYPRTSHALTGSRKYLCAQGANEGRKDLIELSSFGIVQEGKTRERERSSSSIVINIHYNKI